MFYNWYCSEKGLGFRSPNKLVLVASITTAEFRMIIPYDGQIDGEGKFEN